jgi:hypothetical protein
MQTNGIYSQMAIDALNALVGSIDATGGLLIQRKPPFSKWPPIQRDAISGKGLSQPRADGVAADRGGQRRLEAIFPSRQRPKAASTTPPRGLISAKRARIEGGGGAHGAGGPAIS